MAKTRPGPEWYRNYPEIPESQNKKAEQELSAVRVEEQRVRQEHVARRRRIEDIKAGMKLEAEAMDETDTYWDSLDDCADCGVRRVEGWRDKPVPRPNSNEQRLAKLK